MRLTSLWQEGLHRAVIHADGYAVLTAVPHAELGAHLYALAQFLLCNQSLQAVNNIIRPFQMAGAADADIDRSHL